MIKEKFSLKDHLFNKEKVEKIAYELSQVYPAFQTKDFIQETIVEFPNLELKDRIRHIRTMLRKHLPGPYPEAMGIILASLPQALNESKTDGDFGDFIYAPYGDFVASYGLNKENLETSFNALYEITKRFSCEDAIRPFIINHEKVAMKKLVQWTRDANYHVRRLCSEGSRPSLPWSQKINLTPDQSMSILRNLYNDPTRYVVRSVANHLNDLSKKHPEVVINQLKEWEKKNNNKEEFLYLKKHALRTLIKQGNPEAFKLLGFTTELNITVDNIKHSETVVLNSHVDFSFTLQTPEPSQLVIDYLVLSPDSKGNQTKKKVYKLTNIKVLACEKYTVSKKHFFRTGMTTRTWNTGIYTIIIQINGVEYSKFNFEVKK
jgi:3-methyladenine DNA glycosylase AlkC